MIERLTATLAVDSRDKLGEGPVWDGKGQRLIWSDHQTGVVHEARSDGAVGWYESRQWNLARHLAGVMPRVRGGLIVLSGTEVLALDDDGGTKPFAHIDVDSGLIRINDAKCDLQGRLWAGTLSSDFRPGAAALYRIDADASVHLMLAGVTLANGLDWSPDGSIFYFIDSLTRCVDAFRFDATAGTISDRRTIVRVKDGIPNGMCVDREGCLWLAATGAGQVQRYAPSGELLAVVSISTPGATSCAFGGPDGGDLCITSRSGRMPDVALTVGLAPEMMEGTSPDAGGLFVCRPGATGAPSTPFAG